MWPFLLVLSFISWVLRLLQKIFNELYFRTTTEWASLHSPTGAARADPSIIPTRQQPERNVYLVSIWSTFGSRAASFQCTHFPDKWTITWARISDQLAPPWTTWKILNAPVVLHASLIQSVCGRQASTAGTSDVTRTFPTKPLARRFGVALVASLLSTAPVPIPPVQPSITHPNATPASGSVHLVLTLETVLTKELCFICVLNFRERLVECKIAFDVLNAALDIVVCELQIVCLGKPLYRCIRQI